MDDVEHGIEAACYSNGPGGFLPTMICTCGFHTSRACYTWEEAGEEFDSHLSGVRAHPVNERSD